jgi:exonuclease SbcC
MKILSVYIKNLNSLVGETKIDFTAPPLSETGLFAITGETGAGKSTILDAIALAMYNSIPRGSSEDDIMSYGTAEALAEVVFKTMDGTFMATWTRKRARGKIDGTLQPSSWRLSDISNPANPRIIGEKKKEVEREIIRITGLDIDKFTQSVLLAQGKFAAFMQANPNVRGELLEKITRQTDFSKYSIEAYKKYQEENFKLIKLKEELDREVLLSEEECLALEQQIIDLNTLSTECKTKLELISNSMNWLQSMEDAKNKKTVAQTNFDLSAKAIEDSKEIKARIELHEKTFPFSEDLGAILNLESEIKNSQNTLTKLNVELPILKSQMQSAQQLLTDLLTKKDNTSKELKNLEPQFTLAIQLDEIIKGLQENVKIITDEYNKLSDQIKSDQSKLKEKKDAYNKQKTTISELETWLSTNANYEQIGKVIGQVQTKIEEYDRNQESFSKKSKSLAERNNSIKVLTKDHEAANKKSSLLKNQLDEIGRKQKEKIIALKKLLANKDIKLSRIKKEKLNDTLALYIDLFKISEEWETSIAEKESGLKELEGKTEKQKTLLKKKAGKEKEIEQLKELLASVETNYENELLIKNYEEDRKKLTEGKECFLCGSKKHPWVSGKHKAGKSIYAKQLNDTKAKIEKVNAEIKELTSKIPSDSEIKLLAKSVSSASTKITKLLKDFNAIAKKTKDKNIKIESSDAILNKRIQMEDEFNGITKVIEKAEQLDEEIKILSDQLSEKKGLLHEVEITEKELQTKCKALKSTILESQADHDKMEILIKKLYSELTLIIHPYQIDLSESKTADIISKLNDKKKEFENKLKDKTQAEKSEVALKTEIKEIENALKLKLENELPLKSKAKEDNEASLILKQDERKEILNGR